MNKTIIVAGMFAMINFSLASQAETGACYVFYKIGNNQEVMNCEDDFTKESCLTREEQVRWLIAKKLQHENKGAVWTIWHRWYPSVSCMSIE